MENDDIRQAVLIELRLMRRAVRGILLVLACGIVLAVLWVIHPDLGKIAVILSGIIAVVAVVAAVLGIGAARVINRMKDK